MVTMARKRKPGAGRPKGTRPARERILSFRVTEEFGDWFDGLVEHCRQEADWTLLPTTAVNIQALICLARERGYDREPPKQ